MRYRMLLIDDAEKDVEDIIAILLGKIPSKAPIGFSKDSSNVGTA